MISCLCIWWILFFNVATQNFLGMLYFPLTNKKRQVSVEIWHFFGGEQGIRTLEAVLATYTISNRAPSTSSDNSP